MAGENGSEPSALIDNLAAQTHAYDFFWAVRLLECAHESKPKVGHSTKPADDPIRFSHEAIMGFAPSTLKSFEPIEGLPGVYRLSSYFLGLLGPDGPMPVHITDFAVKQREREGYQASMPAFLDIFHHRMISLFYRAWAVCQPTVSYEHGASRRMRGGHGRPDATSPGETDRFAFYVGSLIGIMRSDSASAPIWKKQFARNRATLL